MTDIRLMIELMIVDLERKKVETLWPAPQGYDPGTYQCPTCYTPWLDWGTSWGSVEILEMSSWFLTRFCQNCLTEEFSDRITQRLRLVPFLIFLAASVKAIVLTTILFVLFSASTFAIIIGVAGGMTTFYFMQGESLLDEGVRKIGGDENLDWSDY